MTEGGKPSGLEGAQPAGLEVGSGTPEGVASRALVVAALAWSAAAPMAAAYGFARLELGGVPARAMASVPRGDRIALDHAAALTWTYGWPLLVAVWILGAALLVARTRRGRGWPTWTLLAAATILTMGQLHQTLAKDVVFASDPRVLGGLAGGGIALLLGVGACFGLSRAAASRPPSLLLRAWGWSVPPLCGLAAFVAAWINERMWEGLYAPVHLAGAQLTLFALALAAMLVLALPWRPPAGIALVGATIAGALAGLGVHHIRAGDVDAEALVQRYVNAHTQIGKGRVVYVVRVSERRALEAGELMPRDEAVEIFAADAGLPRLPRELDLEDYNLLVVTIEATRRDMTSLHDPDLDTSPHLLAFARARGIDFARAYAPSATTVQSVSAMSALTYPSSAPLTLWRQPWSGQLRPEADTLAEALREVGYDTWWVGHNHRSYFGERIVGLEQGFDEVIHVEKAYRKADVVDADARIAQLAVERLARSEGRRFFGWIFFVSPHHEYVTHDETRPHETPLERYQQEIRNADAALGEVLAALEAQGHLEDTIVVITSDHGEQFHEHGGWRHASGVYEELVHVPLVVSIPGQPARVHPTPTSTVHLLTGLLMTSPGPLRERALLAVRRVFAPTLAATRGAIVVELLGRTLDLSALIGAQGKIIVDRIQGVHEIYDLAADPEEQSDLALEADGRWEALVGAAEAFEDLRARLVLTAHDADKTKWTPADDAAAASGD